MDYSVDILLVLDSFRAEGTPRMALILCKKWMEWGLKPGVVVLSNQWIELKEEFELLNIPLFVRPIPARRFLRHFELIKGIYLACRSLRAKTLLCMPSGLHFFIGMGAHLAGIQRVVVHQGVYPWHWHREQFWKYRVLYRLGRFTTDTVVACSKYVEEGIKEHLKLSANKLVTIYNGVALDEFYPMPARSHYSNNRRRAIVGMVGRLDLTKDQESLIRAVSLVKSTDFGIELWLIGNGDKQDELQKLAQELDVIESIKFLGLQKDVGNLLRHMDLFAYSVKEEEGFGIALAEAMAVGIPVVASDVGGCREVLDSGRLGLLVEPGDPKAMADGIANVLSDSEAATKRALLAHDRAVREFSDHAMARGYAGVLGFEREAHS